jgi:hypothetical protein
MAIAMMYASPTVIEALNDGKRRRAGTVARANIVKTIQPLLYCFVRISDMAQIAMGNAKHAKNNI